MSFIWSAGDKLWLIVIDLNMLAWCFTGKYKMWNSIITSALAFDNAELQEMWCVLNHRGWAKENARAHVNIPIRNVEVELLYYSILKNCSVCQTLSVCQIHVKHFWWFLPAFFLHYFHAGETCALTGYSHFGLRSGHRYRSGALSLWHCWCSHYHWCSSKHSECHQTRFWNLNTVEGKLTIT